MSALEPNPLSVLSTHLANAVAAAVGSVVAVLGRGRASSSGFVWRPGVVVTASDALEREENLVVVLGDGTRLAATLAGRDPTTDIAVLRIDQTTTPAVAAPGPRSLRVGELVLSIGRRSEGPIARLGLVAVAGGPWQSLRGGRIDRTIRLDRRIHGSEEGGVLIDADGGWIGMTVSGPRGAALAIPAETIERVAAQLLAHGRIARGYLGLGLQPVRLDDALVRALSLSERRGVIVVNADPDGPGRRAGVLIGDIIVSWNGDRVHTVREVFRRLGPDAVGAELILGIIRGGEARTITLKVAERPAS
jgi:S1-C subfamily serine protease